MLQDLPFSFPVVYSFIYKSPKPIKEENETLKMFYLLMEQFIKFPLSLVLRNQLPKKKINKNNEVLMIISSNFFF